MGNALQKLQKVQELLKAPKGQYNSFGKYKYRSCEDILTAVKPLLSEVGAVIVLEDYVEMIGNRFYIRATATFYNIEGRDSISNSAYAREDESKKGMDGSQITGTASSYARKYALNGLLLIDDTKDADTDENRNERDSRAAQEQARQKAYPPRKDMIDSIQKWYQVDKLLTAYRVNSIDELDDAKVMALYNKAIEKINQQKK